MGKRKKGRPSSKWRNRGIEWMSDEQRRAYNQWLSPHAQAKRRKVPRAERWFQRELARAGLRHKCDYFNEQLGYYIPDLYNTQYRYIVEIDERKHFEDEYQHKKDIKKNAFYEKLGFRVFRVPAYRTEALKFVLEKIAEIQGRKLSPAYEPKAYQRYDFQHPHISTEPEKKPFVPRVIVRKKAS